jgi:hypothetical protein
MQSRSEPAKKFTYNPYTETWQSQQVSRDSPAVLVLLGWTRCVKWLTCV